MLWCMEGNKGCLSVFLCNKLPLCNVCCMYASMLHIMCYVVMLLCCYVVTLLWYVKEKKSFCCLFEFFLYLYVM